MSDFKAKMHQNRFRLQFRPRPHCGSLHLLSLLFTLWAAFCGRPSSLSFFLRAILGLPVTVTAVLRRTVCGPNLVGGRSGKWRAQASNQPIECIPRVGHGSLLQNTTQPQISGPNPQTSSPDPTQSIIVTWYGTLGYTEYFIQQLLPYIQHLDSTFYKPTVNESYYSAVVLINRQ